MEEKNTIWYAIAGIVGTASAVLGFEPVLMYILMSAFALDTLLGTIKAIKFKKFTSGQNFLMIITKVLGLCLVFVATYFLGQIKYIPAEMMGVVAVSILIANELLSASANYIEIKTGKKIKEVDAITEAIRAVHKLLLKVVQNTLGKLQGKEEK